MHSEVLSDALFIGASNVASAHMLLRSVNHATRWPEVRSWTRHLGIGQNAAMSAHQSVAKLESQRTALLLSEDSLRTVLRDPKLAPALKQDTQHELQVCLKSLSEITQKIEALEAKR